MPSRRTFCEFRIYSQLQGDGAPFVTGDFSRSPKPHAVAPEEGQRRMHELCNSNYRFPVHQ